MEKNIDRWLYYLKDYGSPMSFKLWGFYSMTSSVLQRRVYLGSTRKTLYPNMYTILTAPAGKGKGMILGEVSEIMRHPKLKRVKGLDEKKDEIKKELEQNDIQLSTKPSDANARLKNMVIPMAPNATTFEALTNIMGNCASPLRFTDEQGNLRVQMHSSLYVHLEELGSLFRKHTEDIHTLLCELYDCKDPYEYRTKHMGVDYIRRPCVNILAGTTPDFLKRVFSSSLLSEGFASRTVFVVAMKEEFRRFETPTFTDEQIAEHEKLVDHIVKLSQISGCCKFSPEALEFCKAVWEDPDFDKNRPNSNPKLDAYYSRKNITLAKLAMSMHFADSLEMEIPLNIVQDALKLLDETERSMHLALSVESKNPLAFATDGVLKYFMLHKEANVKTLRAIFYDDLPEPFEDMEKILRFLSEEGKIKENGKPNTYKLIDKNGQEI